MNQNERDEIVRLFEAQRQLQRADAVPDRLNEMGLEENMEDGEEENGRHNVPWLGHMEEEMEEEAYDSGRSSIEEMDDHLQEINRNVDFARPALKRRHDPNSDPCDAQLKRKKTEEEEEMDKNIRKSDRG
ncbi:Protein CBG28070 [Caenorhabditis briggsae]|uniref:Protein CBG28070 n=1 Tax=Caenorhabditis briggsae TaxID=6238 RepID=B6IGR0_CAEBR|nr:Protein CBG28070 [Caenorhabditis briggsae]CAR99090.1 Protein CBG28070 [Caenorhabditis briggsae]